MGRDSVAGPSAPIDSALAIGGFRLMLLCAIELTFQGSLAVNIGAAVVEGLPAQDKYWRGNGSLLSPLTKRTCGGPTSGALDASYVSQRATCSHR
jgi:hypothetical protein